MIDALSVIGLRGGNPAGAPAFLGFCGADRAPLYKSLHV